MNRKSFAALCLSVAATAVLAASVAFAAAPGGPGARGPGGFGGPGGPGGFGGGRAGRGGPATPPAPFPEVDVTKRASEMDFGKTRDGTDVKLFTLRNHSGSLLRVMTFGATIQDIEMPDKDGKMANCCLSSGGAFNQNFQQLAYTVGRVANRIANGKFTLEGKEYVLDPSGQAVLHSGNSNYGTRVWEGKLLPEKDHETSVMMTMKSPDGDGNFPGNVTLNVTFSLTDDNEVRLDYEGTTDKTTLLAPTNHCYFALGGPINDYEVMLNADKYTPGGTGRGGNLIPSGEIAPVAGTNFDFTKPAKIGSRANGSYDNSWVLNNWKPGKNPGGGEGGVQLAGTCYDPSSGRLLTIKTDQPGVQMYTGGRTGVAFEAQHFPDSIHHDNFPSTVLKPGETFHATTVYAFSVKK